jgi:hypothetical protein
MIPVYALVLAADSLLGIWHGDTTFGPRVHGTLRLEQSGVHWSAHIAGLTADAHVAGDTVTIVFPDSVGEFRGHLVGARSVVG